MFWLFLTGEVSLLVTIYTLGAEWWAGSAHFSSGRNQVTRKRVLAEEALTSGSVAALSG